ncbi:DUF547 domain-containing protein [Thermodesulfobacteriota bacterium]
MKRKSIVLMMTILLMTGVIRVAAATPFDHSRFDQILHQYVNDKGRVDYNGIAANPTFKAYIKSLESADIDAEPINEQLAFWLNVYNAVTIDKVIKWKPKKSVRETLFPGVWTATKFFTTRKHTVAGKRLSQDDIEHNILRKQFKDPRIHFAIICASSGCPPQPRFAYTEDNVQTKLEEETRKYINSQRGIRIDYAENTLYLSKLFDWFAGDFEFKAGSVLGFVKPYLSEDVRVFLERKPKMAYIHYDWSLNAQEPLK